jgi:DNA-binding transcriptional regulator YdaS (Cro superfamily)
MAAGFVVLLVIAIICIAAYFQVKTIKAKEKVIREKQILETELYNTRTITYTRALAIGRAIKNAVDTEGLARTILWEQLGLDNQVDAGWKYQLKQWADKDKKCKDDIAKAREQIKAAESKIRSCGITIDKTKAIKDNDTALIEFFLSSDK